MAFAFGLLHGFGFASGLSGPRSRPPLLPGTAAFVDMTVVLNKFTFSRLSGPAVEILEDGWLTATVIGGP